MHVLLINNDGGGFADHVEVAEGTSVLQLFSKHLPTRRPEDFLVRVNRQPAARDEPLKPGDRVSITPIKIEGALSV